MTKKFFALTLVLLTVIFVATAEAGIVTDRFPLFCYVDHQVDTYNQPNGQKVGYISANVDLIRVTQVRGDGWAYGDYPGRNGRVAHWFRINELCADSSYSNRSVQVNGSYQVYRTKSGNNTIGSIANETVIVLADNGSRAQIIYRLNNGTGYKMGWVPSSTVSSRNVQPVVPSPIANTVTISDGWYRIQPMHDLGRSADALGTPIGNGNNIHMWTAADIPQQKFYLQNRGNGYFSLQSNYGDKLFVTADGRGNGANLYTSDWKNSDSQLFRLVNAGNNSYHVFAKVGVNLNFDCAGAGRSDGTNLQLWTSENNDWHKWRFTKVSVDNKANFRLNNYSLSSPSNYQLRFTGKLWNANNLSEITGIHVYIGGGVGAGGQFLGEFRADKTNHNFDSTLNVPQNRTGNQLVVIYAVNGIESKELDRRNINISPMSVDNSRTGIQKRLMQAVFHTTQGTRVSTGGDFDGYIDLKNKYGWIHEGIDLVWYYKAPVYAAISGEIVRAGEPSFNTVAIYDKTNNITVVYLHLDSVANGIYEGKKVDKNTLIGYQGYKGAPNQTPEGSHVHIEIRTGLKRNAATSKDTHKDNPDPYPYWDKLL